MKLNLPSNFCAMCGSTNGQSWETDLARRSSLALVNRPGCPSETWVICDECNEGLQNAAPIKPDRLQLLTQIRRATIDDQKAVLEWLHRKFKLRAVADA